MNILEAVRSSAAGRSRLAPSASTSTTASSTSPRMRSACSRSEAFRRRCSSRPASPTEGSRSPWCSGRPRLLSWDEIVELDREGTLEFEAHSISHPNLLSRRRRPRTSRDPGVEGRARRPAWTPRHRLLLSGRPVRGARTPARRRCRVRHRRLLRAGRQPSGHGSAGASPPPDRRARQPARLPRQARRRPRHAPAAARHLPTPPLRRSDPPPADELAAVDVDMRPLKRLKTEVLANALAAVRSQPAPKGGIVEEAFEGGREPNGIARRDEQARLTIVDRFRHAADRRGDHGQRRRHRLEDRDRQPFRGAREHEDVGAPPGGRPRRCGRREAPPHVPVRAGGSPPRAPGGRDRRRRPRPRNRCRIRPSARTRVSGSLGRCSRPTDTTLGSAPSLRVGCSASAATPCSDHDRPLGVADASRDSGDALALGDADRDRRERTQHPLRPSYNAAAMPE